MISQNDQEGLLLVLLALVIGAILWADSCQRTAAVVDPVAVERKR